MCASPEIMMYVLRSWLNPIRCAAICALVNEETLVRAIPTPWVAVQTVMTQTAVLVGTKGSGARKVNATMEKRLPNTATQDGYDTLSHT